MSSRFRPAFEPPSDDQPQSHLELLQHARGTLRRRPKPVILEDETTFYLREQDDAPHSSSMSSDGRREDEEETFAGVREATAERRSVQTATIKSRRGTVRSQST